MSADVFGLNSELQRIPILRLGRRNVSERLKQALGVEPGSPFEGGQFQGLPHFPGGPAVDQFGLVETVDGFSQGVVAGIPCAANGRLNTGLGPAPGVADGNVLRSVIRRRDQAGIPLGLAGVERLFRRISRSTGQRATGMPSRGHCRQTLSASWT